MEQLALPVDKPRGFGLSVMALFLHPEASLLVVVDVDRVWPSGRREKQLGRPCHALRDLTSSRRWTTDAPAERVGS
jgi:hypothetical protein